MRAADTNVFVRLVVRDDARQYERVKNAGELWMSLVVLQEFVWVVASVYGFDVPAQCRAIEMLLGHEQVAVESPAIVRAALDRFVERPKLGFADCLVLEVARGANRLPLLTFDRTFARLDGVEYPP